MFAGADVKEALPRVLTDNAQKSNIFGAGFREGGPVGLGCSRKGKIWGREFGSLSGWKDWCDDLGERLLNENFDPKVLIENALVAERQNKLPDRVPWFIDWPEKLMPRKDGSTNFTVGDAQSPLHQWSIQILEYDLSGNRVVFGISHESSTTLFENFSLLIDPDAPHGHKVTKLEGVDVSLRIGRDNISLVDFFNDYLPAVTFTDQSILEGCELLTPKDQPSDFNLDQAEPIVWAGISIRKESFLKNGALRHDSVQAYAIRRCIAEGFQIVFDDDGSNEIADIIAIRDIDNQLTIRLLHCKYSGADIAGARIKDVVEVTSQAVKNAPWFWNMERLGKRMFLRNRDRSSAGFPRFISGTPNLMKKVLRLTELSANPIREVVVVQPGTSLAVITPQIITILGSADSYLRMATGCPLTLWCSA